MSSIQHDSHTHPLTKFDNVRGFICDGCGFEGSGKRYRCETCDYDLHEYCATCPLTLPATFLHPQHELSLFYFIKRKKLSTLECGRLCDICKGPIKGTLFYRCEICDFNVHSICSNIPQYVKGEIHPAHNLNFQPHLPGTTACEVCHDPCQSYSYGCELCRLNFHLGCLGEWERSPGNTEASSSSSDGNVICKDCGSKDSVKQGQCKPCRELKWERRTKRVERVKDVLEPIMGFLG